MSKSQRSTRLFTAAVMALAVLFIHTTSVQAQRAKHAAPWIGKQVNGKDCKGYQVGYGPYDYLDRYSYLPNLAVVENAHFDEEVENLIRGRTSTPMGDIDYVLKTWPNHHRALKSAMVFSLRYKTWPEWSRGQPAECYFQRALNYSPYDGAVYSMFAVYLHQKKQYKPALEAYRKAVKFLPEDILLQYNMGLTLVQLKQYKEAREIAEIVYAAGFPLPALKNKLIAAKQWDVDSHGAEPSSEKPKYTQAQIAAYKKAMLEKSAQGKTTPEGSVQAEAEAEAEAEAGLGLEPELESKQSTDTSDEGVDPPVVSH